MEHCEIVSNDNSFVSDRVTIENEYPNSTDSQLEFSDIIKENSDIIMLENDRDYNNAEHLKNSYFEFENQSIGDDDNSDIDDVFTNFSEDDHDFSDEVSPHFIHTINECVFYTIETIEFFLYAF